MASVCQSRQLKASSVPEAVPGVGFHIDRLSTNFACNLSLKLEQNLLSTTFLFIFKNVSSTFEHRTLFNYVAQSLL